MGFLKKLRSKTRLKRDDNASETSPSPRYSGPDYVSRFDGRTLHRIFSYVSPHALDDSYEKSEKSIVAEGCVLCDTRDLASCAQVNRAWHNVAERML